MTEETIGARLSALADSHDVRVLFAAESGSRAWGFASPDSDFDVRFVFVRTPRGYLCVRPPRDTIELPVDADGFDASGWDLLKTLGLFRRGNGPLFEWLFSPIVYRESGALAPTLRRLATERFPARPLAHHYLAMAKKTYREEIAGRDAVVRKRALYALRPLLVCRWIASRLDPAPTAVADLLAGIELNDVVRARLDALLAAKRAGVETAAAPPDPVLLAFLADEIARLETIVPGLPHPPSDDTALDALLWQELGV